MDHLSELTDQHKTIRRLISSLGNIRDTESRKKYLTQIRSVIENHFFMEESLIYPKLGTYEELQSWSVVLWESHENIRNRLNVLMQSNEHEVSFSLARKVFEEEIANHFSDEETHVYPNVRLLLPYSELLEIENSIKMSPKQKIAA